MPQLHLFNPGHETAVLLGKSQYTPTANVLKMQKDLALLPLWYGEKGDYVWMGEKADNSYLPSLPKGLILNASLAKLSNLRTELIAVPWGLSPQSLKVFEDLKEKQGITLHIPEWKDEYIPLTGRQTAALCLDKIKQLLPDYPLPETPVFYTNITDIKKHLSAHNPPFVIKAPYSSSGRGILWIHSPALAEKEAEWTQGAIRKQGYVSIEKGLQKLQDFALEFYLNEQGDVNYKGLSVFDTAKGAYSGNRLVAQDRMLKELLLHIEETLFEKVKSAVMQTIKKVYGKTYTGYLGVDMMLYTNHSNTVRIHPCIEINMRYTMGMVAIRLFEDYISPSAEGYFHITYDNDNMNKDAEMKNKHPLQLDNGRISRGYLSLCPVTKETRYRAYLIIE